MSNRLSSVKTQPGCACTALVATLFALGSSLHRFLGHDDVYVTMFSV